MATIIEFPVERILRDEKRDTNEALGRTAELLFFTGVRYSRDDGGPVRVNSRNRATASLEKRSV